MLLFILKQLSEMHGAERLKVMGNGLAHNNMHFLHFSYVACMSLPQRLVEVISKYDKLVKCLSCYTSHRAITITYDFREDYKLEMSNFPTQRLYFFEI